MRSPPIKPTDAELHLLQALWREGRCTLKQLHEAVNPPAGYTTVQKLLQILMEKGLVRRVVAKKPCVYEAAYSENQTQQHLLSGLVKKAFGGSPSKLVMQVLASKKTSAKDLVEIQRLIEIHKKN